MPAVYCHRGQLHLLQQDLAKAVDDLKRSVQLDGGSILARIQLGMAHHRSTQMSEARSAFQSAEQAFPESPDALNYHGEFLVEIGDLQGAGSHFESALTITATQPDQQAALAQTKIEIGLAQGNLQFSEWMITGFGAQ